MSALQQKWDAIYRQQSDLPPEAATVVSRYSHLLPEQGKALDLACGLGGNAFLLAQHGLQVDAWDISKEAIDNIKANTPSQHHINAQTVDIHQVKFPEHHYDVITVSRFLDRAIIPDLINALKPKGLIFYQTFTLEKAYKAGPTNPDFLLKKAELLELFSALTAVIYHEESCLGDTKIGIRNEALLVAQR